MLVFSTQIFTFFVSSFQSAKLGILDLNLRKKERKKKKKRKKGRKKELQKDRKKERRKKEKYQHITIARFFTNSSTKQNPLSK
jgi:hypothetical protein